MFIHIQRMQHSQIRLIPILVKPSPWSSDHVTQSCLARFDEIQSIVPGQESNEFGLWCRVLGPV